MEMVAGFDTSAYMRESCLVIGRKDNVDGFYKKAERILRNSGHNGPIHWKHVSKEQRKKAIPALALTMKESGLCFLNFRHERPPNFSKKTFFLDSVPRLMSAPLEEQLKDAEGILHIYSDSDFNCISSRGAQEFLYKLMKRLGTRLANAEVTPKYIKEGLFLRVTKPGGKTLSIIGKLATRDERVITVADIAMGVVRESARPPDRTIKIDLAKGL
jgi:hypothetical protein